MRPACTQVDFALHGGQITNLNALAINKPPHLSSAQVLRNLQLHFTSSRLFAPLLDQQKADRSGAKYRGARRKKDTNVQVKMGHGGTLDPLATGLLIVGIGKGTKHLQDFLGCTKTYETVVLFGKATDTYDVAGKIVAEAPYKHITAEMVEDALAKFRGNIKQMPPLYSALKIDGMKAYEYARSGEELPRQLESRAMEVQECEMLEWYEGGKHDFRWPAEEASEKDKQGVTRQMGGAEATIDTSAGTGLKRKLPSTEEIAVDLKETSPKRPKTEATQGLKVLEKVSSSSRPVSLPRHGHARIKETSFGAADTKPTLEASKAALHTHTCNLSSSPSPGPAAAIRLRVSSGFYVRSFAHDLGLSLSPPSCGIMASLVRSRQADFGLDAALTYDDLEGGEKLWGPKVAGMLEKWMNDHQGPSEDKIADRDRPWYRSRGGKGFSTRTDFSEIIRHKTWNGETKNAGWRRNSSSPEI